ncbi:GW dipeptide domain-containing protein [Nitrosophilus alvini]|uniref:GW dipeptide domain-containing protein n=1 Tax=Nitrosophilus alvini TaxID=2714855 RepID=UPI00190DB905|nr:GW dipeptide domain-containing protein [Nitrosophilus alvini]
MKKAYISIALAALLLSGCGEKPKEEKNRVEVLPEKTEKQVSTEQTESVEGLYGVSADEAKSEPQPPQQPGVKTGTVIETMNAGGYTYAKIDDNGNIYWIAGPQTEIKTGDNISFAPQMWMENFQSKTLNRTFDKILFVAVIAPLKGTNAHACESCDTHKNQAVTAQTSQDSVQKQGSGEKIAKAEGGYTIAEIFQKKEELKNKTVKVRGKVTKVSRAIMGKDWVHIEDGSESDLVITSPSANVEVGDVVTATGILKTDVDFGYGYFYPVIMEEAKFEK